MAAPRGVPNTLGITMVQARHKSTASKIEEIQKMVKGWTDIGKMRVYVRSSTPTLEAFLEKSHRVVINKNGLCVCSVYAIMGPDGVVQFFGGNPPTLVRPESIIAEAVEVFEPRNRKVRR